MKWVLFAWLSIAALASGVRADEIRLKDGSKIIGNVVGYEDGSFKVKTDYGFATVRKDSIAEIIPAEPKESAPPKAAPGKSAEEAAPVAVKPTAPAEPKPRPAPVKSTLTADTKPQPPPMIKPSPAPAPETAASVTPHALAHNAAPAPNSAAQPAAPVATPAPVIAAPLPPAATPPAPLPVQELVRGNLYVNQTYGFEMYKPPDWELIADARAALPNAVVALGTTGQTTLFVVGRDQAHDSLDDHSAATDKALREIYDNYRPLPSTRTMIAGSPAIERRFRGAAENRDWSVFLVTLVRGPDVFTILAMTDANSDLVQFQENVIAKTIASLQFTTPRS